MRKELKRLSSKKQTNTKENGNTENEGQKAIMHTENK